MANPTAATAAKSIIGLKDLVIAPVTKDDDTGVTYGDLKKVAGAIKATVTPENADPDVQYADDGEYDVVYPDPTITFETELVGLPLDVQEMLLGNTIDSNGVLIRSDKDTPEYFAVGFRSEKADHTYRYVWLYKVRANPITEEYNTREGTTVNRTTTTISWTAIKRNYDGKYQAVADEGLNGFTAEKAATFLNSVYTPALTA